MKQHITKEQWDEVRRGMDIPEVIYNQLIGSTKYRLGDEILQYITIGFLIEFLGDNWEWKARENCKCIDNEALLPKNICDSLWEAVKYKLNK